MKKSELEGEWELYGAVANQVQAAETNGLYAEAVRLAVKSFDHLEAAIQYQRRYQERETPSVPTLEVALTYAPVLLDAEALAQVDLLLERRSVRTALSEVAEQRERAESVMWLARAVCGHLEQYEKATLSEIHEQVGGDRRTIDSILVILSKAGFCERHGEGRATTFLLITRMDGETRGLCSHCGIVFAAPKQELLVEFDCPSCRRKSQPVILADGSDEGVVR